MNGHGHVIPNEDGSKARCGGPAICTVCQREAGRIHEKLSLIDVQHKRKDGKL